MSDGLLVQTMQRIMSVLDEIDERKADIKDIYAEAKGHGFDKAAIGLAIREIRGRDKAQTPAAEERAAIVDLYVSTFDNAPRTYVHVPAREGISQNTPERPSDRDVSAVDKSSSEAGPQAEASLAGTGSETLAGREGRPEEHPGSRPEMGARTAQPIHERKHLALRPHCLRPELCGSYGSKHCFECERAAKASEDEEAATVPAFIRKTHGHAIGDQA